MMLGVDTSEPVLDTRSALSLLARLLELKSLVTPVADEDDERLGRVGVDSMLDLAEQ